MKSTTHDWKVFVADAALADHHHFALRHLIVVRHRDLEIADPCIDADRCLGVYAVGSKQRADDDQHSDRLAHRWLSADSRSKAPAGSCGRDKFVRTRLLAAKRRDDRQYLMAKIVFRS